MAEEKTDTPKIATPKANLAMTNMGFVPTDIESAYRHANLIAKSDFALQMYKGNQANCMILLEVSIRLGVPWMMLMQHMYIIHERPALDATISTALVNKSGVFKDPIEYEAEGGNAKDSDYRVRAYATRVSTGKVLYGPWIDWQLVKGEGWDSKSGSKWKTMPDQMFHYRAASWFQRRYCPEVTMGMMTTDEVLDMPRKHVDSKAVEEGKPKPTVERILAQQEPPQDHSADADKKADDAKTEPEKPSRKPRSDKGKKKGKAGPPPGQETEPDVPKVKCPKCSEEVDPAVTHDCNPAPPEIQDEEETPEHTPEHTTETEPTTVGKDTHKCGTCDRQFPKEKIVDGEKCPSCYSLKITELA